MSLPEGIKGLECKHATYVVATDQSPNDLVVAKERIHFSDGRYEDRLRLFENFKRDFWVTYPLHRKHKQKKEWESLQRLQRFKSTQIELVKNAARALGVPIPPNGQLRTLARSPYLYGCDITTPALIKRRYMDQFPDCISDNTIAVSDIESDVLHLSDDKEPDIIMQALTMKEKAYLVVLRRFFEGLSDERAERNIRIAAEQLIGNVIHARQMQLEIEFVDRPGDIPFKVLQKAHQWKPDFLTFWNMDYDITHMTRMLEEAGYDLGEVWSDPEVPKRYRSFKYKQGPSQKVTASGKTMPLSPAEQWHTVIAPSSFYVIDAMCVYLKLRIAKGKAPSYALNEILAKELNGLQKLHLPETDHLRGVEWHREMQRRFKAEYCVYNIFDCIAVELLDEKTTDLSRQISSQCGHSEYSKMPSQPRRTCDDLHFVALQEGMVAATTSDQMVSELDQYVVDHDNWIVTLRSDLIHDNGLKLIEELPDIHTYLRRDVADLDVAGTYPNEEIIFNISAETTMRETCQIVGISETMQRATGINLSGGYVNAVEIMTNVFNAPTFHQILAYYYGQNADSGEYETMLQLAAAHMQSEEDVVVDVEPEDED